MMESSWDTVVSTNEDIFEYDASLLGKGNVFETANTES